MEKRGTRVLSSRFGNGNLVNSKRSQVNWYLIISLILGILMLVIAVFWIFQEYFTGEDMDWEMCRQAIVLRNFIPGDYTSEMKEAVTLKCKTSAFVIKTEDEKEAAKEIVEIMFQCFNLMGEGKVEIFERNTWRTYSNCLICARISIKPELREHYKNVKIPLWEYLKNNNAPNGQNYLEYFYSPMVNHEDVKNCNIDVKSEDFRTKVETPLFWDNSDKDIFITVTYLNKRKYWGPSLEFGGCDWITLRWGEQKETPPSAPFISYLDTIKSCDNIFSIPA